MFFFLFNFRVKKCLSLSKLLNNKHIATDGLPENGKQMTAVQKDSGHCFNRMKNKTVYSSINPVR